MPRLVLKTDTGDEPKDSRAWPAWAVQRLREARTAGAEVPRFQQTNPWALWELRRLIWSDDELHTRVEIDIHAREVRWT